MVQLGPELAPEAGVTMAALAALGALCAYIVAFGLVKLCTVISEAIFFALKWALKHIPFGKRILNLALLPVEQAIINLFGRAAQALDGLIAHSWHDLAKLTRILGREIEGLALDLYHQAGLLKGLPSLATMTWYVKQLLHPIRAVQEIERKLRRAEAVAVAHIRHMVLRGVYPRLRGAEGAIEGVLIPELLDLRGRARALDKEYRSLWRYLRARPWLIASAAMTGTVALCLRRLGLGWLRCRNVGRVGKHICGLPATLIDTLLGLTLAFGAIEQPETIARLALGAEEPIEKALRELLS